MNISGMSIRSNDGDRELVHGPCGESKGYGKGGSNVRVRVRKRVRDDGRVEHTI